MYGCIGALRDRTFFRIWACSKRASSTATVSLVLRRAEASCTLGCDVDHLLVQELLLGNARQYDQAADIANTDDTQLVYHEEDNDTV